MTDASDLANFLVPSSEVSALIAVHDWSATALGAIGGWPAAVRIVIGMILRSPMPIVTLWADDGVMIYNDAYSRFAGTRHPQLLGSNVRAGWPEVADFNDNVVKTVLGKGQSLSFKDQELTLRRGDRPAPAWLNLDYSPVLDDDGSPIGIIAIVVETTDRVLADRQIRDERVRLQQMYEQSPSLMALLDGPEHRFVFLNPAYQKVIGPREVIGKPVAVALPDAVAQGYLDLLDQVFSSGEAYRVDASPYDVQAGPGDPVMRRYLDFVFQPLTDAAGSVTGIFVSGVDVTERILAQDIVREREAQFRLFAETMPNHVWTALPDGHLDWSNDRLADYSGLSTKDIERAGFVGLVHVDDQARAAEEWASAVSSGQHFETELRFRRVDGHHRWHLVRALPLRDDQGCIIRWIGTNTDIDEQKQTEAETTQDRDRLWTLSQELMLVCDHSGVITAVNPTASRLLGWEEQEMLGRSLTCFIHPDDMAATASELAKLSNGATTLAFENRYRHKEGRYCLLDWTAVPEGNRIHAVGRDITEERRLARDRERIWSLSPVLKVIATRSGEITAVNPAWQALLGWSDKETVGRSVLDFIRPQDQAATQSLLCHLRDRLTDAIPAEPVEVVLVAQDGHERHVVWSAVADSDSIYAFGRDISAERNTAAALARSEDALRQAQKMEAIGQLTGGIAHDFNNLLQVIGGNLQLLSGSVAGNDGAQSRIRNALEGVARGSRLASQLLAFGRRQPLAPKVLNLGRLIRRMDEMLRHALGEAVQIDAVVAGGLWNTLIDPGNLENALLNLAINARDAMDGHGRLTIEAENASLDDRYVRAHPDAAPGQYVMLAVTDTGSGIAPDVLEKVFDPFFSTKPEGKGTGLGLSMVYGFVKQSGGHIEIYSEIGEGTTIKLYLPRAMQAEDQVVGHDVGPVTGGSETILVAEDDPAVRETVVETLKSLGYNVLQAADATSALAIIESGMSIDLLFTDVVMPGPMKTPELARRAAERMPGLQVLFTSGYTRNAIVHAGRLDEGIELLSKPYSQEDLARKIRHSLANGAQHKKTDALSGPGHGNIPPADPDRGPLKILLCEDDALIRMSVADMLEDFGHSVLHAGTATKALALLSQNDVDLLLTDVGLPDISGDELARRAREETPFLPVIFATGHSSVEGAGLDDRTGLLVKPFDQAALQAAIGAIKIRV